MLDRILKFSIRNKFIILLFTALIIGFGIFSLTQIPIGAVPDVTNNQVQIITTSRNLSTEDMEQFITYPVELEMSNLPGVKEIRSVSKFGLSVVTIIFEDHMGTYLPRQLIAEKIESASANIPEGFGKPEMGPITTGLGEIYQYILDVKPEYEGRYSPTELRTIQDWIVKRQLSGIPGVVEVNTWGGFLKQYEVALNSAKLKSMDITAGDVFAAMENNNSVAGGGYIEKEGQAYFIRGEGLVGSLDDIRGIAVKTNNGIPVYIRDVADVGFGSANRFGAITGNGEGEKVLGQVMMLKGANSKKVIEAVKERVASISKSLPEGVYINAFLDRSELIGRTTFTITENLLLGCLMVIFVVVLLLGNLRSGLVIASIIPLSLLFAISMMYIFGVDANLMSLGAIDFGIIIDGAVIIVEFIAFQFFKKRDVYQTLSVTEKRTFRDEVSLSGASKMMNSAIFGQLIILIVFIPILSLSGVEGKMFQPMALTFSFALIGAIILCFTYVPVASALFLKPSYNKKPSLASRIMFFVQRMYQPVIDWSINHKKLVLGIAVVLLVGTSWLFSRMGGEFIPTLDEGDFVIQPVLKTGTSLKETTRITTRIEKILLDFPEVRQVVTRIGAAEVPTDPMSMEESDVIIVLNPKDQWELADSKDELAEKFKEALSVIPDMEVEFTQPIEMRFNELITGVRADIAIKIFGEDLSVLSNLGDKIKTLAETVPGAADVTLEKVEGLPEMNVSFDRLRIARHGLDIARLNDMLSMAFGGKKMGSVFEGEKRFDLVVRLQEGRRQNIENLKNLYVDLPAGGKIPLSELADITYQKGAAKISRDDTRRRVVVGINVRDRDLESVVEDISGLIENQIDLPVGYSVTYGGQFENLRTARQRLMVAVPIALFLIFVLLFFAFGSLRDTLMIFSAIPLAAVGGVLLLWIRGMPFSISAGVGFIALFGISVLNGIVLIEHFKELSKEGVKNLDQLVKKGARDRLRPVLLTALAAALGFLPMAVSTNAGAEVQRPLATVVIGGLITATLLTLVVLPILFTLLNRKKMSKIIPVKKKLLIFAGIIAMGFSSNLHAQVDEVGLDELTALALENNAGVRAAAIDVERSDALEGSAFSFGKTELFTAYDENDIAVNGRPLQQFGLRQDFRFPTVYGARRQLLKARSGRAASELENKQWRLKQQLYTAYYNYQITRRRTQIYASLDSLYGQFAYAAQRRFELGETNYLEKITAASSRQKINLAFRDSKTTEQSAYNEITRLVQTEDSLNLKRELVGMLPIDTLSIEQLPASRILSDQLSIFEAQARLTRQNWWPDVGVEYFRATNSQLSGSLYGYQIGLKLPVLFSGQASRAKGARLAMESYQETKKDRLAVIKARRKQLILKLQQLERELEYYQEEGLELADEILKTAKGGYREGEIDFFQYIQSLEHSYEIQLAYLEQLRAYNEVVLSLNFSNQ